MNAGKVLLRSAVVCALLLTFGLISADQQDQPPTIPQEPTKLNVGARPAGKIAFIGSGAVWIMDSDGRNRQQITEVANAQGRLSFSPDNKIIAFSRSGKDASKLPSEEGGMHVLHDIFLAFVDSARTNINWWKRVTFGLGGHLPQWSDNDSIVYYQNDVNANFVDYIVPSHQLAKVSITDGHAEYLRKDWQMLNTSFLMPTFTRDGKKLAYIPYYSDDPDRYVFTKHGVRILEMSDIMAPEAEIKKPTIGLESAVAPSWSPDGQWLAYVSNDMRHPGIFIMSADQKQNRMVFAPTVTQQVYPDPVGWSPDSKWITFATMDGTIYVIDINGEQLRPITGAGNHSNPAWSN
jgi:Tol biopolymer transport system component